MAERIFGPKTKPEHYRQESCLPFRTRGASLPRTSWWLGLSRFLCLNHVWFLLPVVLPMAECFLDFVHMKSRIGLIPSRSSHLLAFFVFCLFLFLFFAGLSCYEGNKASLEQNFLGWYHCHSLALIYVQELQLGVVGACSHLNYDSKIKMFPSSSLKTNGSPWVWWHTVSKHTNQVGIVPVGRG